MVKVLSDLLESELDLAGVVGFVYYISRVEWLGFGEENPPLDPPALSLGRENPSSTYGSINSG